MSEDRTITTTSLRKHSAWAWCALILSVLLHALLIARLPALLLGGLQQETLFPDYPSIALDRVERTPRPAPLLPDRFRPENPGELETLWAEPGPPRPSASLELPVPELPEVSTGPVQGEAEALAEPPTEAPTAAWDPRQDVLQIERAQLDDREAALPRRWSTAAPRTDRVPDVVLPMELAADPVMDEPGALPPGIESLSRPTLRTDSRPSGLEIGPASTLPGARTEALGLPQLEERALPEDSENPEPVESYLTIVSRAYRPSDEPEYCYLEIRISRRSEATLPVLPKDIMFAQDCSESMTPWKLAECKRGLIRWLDQLNPGDRFDVLAFRDTATRCFGEWRPFTPGNKAQALSFIEGLRAQGNTDVYASLQAALSAERVPGRPSLLALITDGRPTTGVTTSSEIIEGFTRSNQGGLSVFGLGGGARVNRFLLDLLSYRNRGDVLVVEETSQIPYAMERWGGETRRPVLSDLTYQFSGIDASSIYPATLSHLYLDRPLTLYARVPADLSPTAFQIIGRSGDHQRDMVFPLELGKTEPGTDEIRSQWVRHRLYEWIGRYLRTPDEATRSDIQNLADRYGQAVPYGFGTTVPRW